MVTGLQLLQFVYVSYLIFISVNIRTYRFHNCYSENPCVFTLSVQICDTKFCLILDFIALRIVVTPSGFPMAGQNFTLTCSLTGGDSLSPTVSYQWRRGESLLTNSPTLHFDSLYLSDAGQYNCVVTLSSSQLDQEHSITGTYNIEFTSEFTMYVKNLFEHNPAFINKSYLLCMQPFTSKCVWIECQTARHLLSQKQ